MAANVDSSSTPLSTLYEPGPAVVSGAGSKPNRLAYSNKSDIQFRWKRTEERKGDCLRGNDVV